MNDLETRFRSIRLVADTKFDSDDCSSLLIKCRRAHTVWDDQLFIPVGISDFERIRELDYYYVDKTGLIKTLLRGEMDQVTLITRPRRFGKKMAMNMLNSFLDIRKDSRHLFKGLEIFDEVEICEKWMNQYPTLFLSFKDVYGSTFENTFNFLK